MKSLIILVLTTVMTMLQAAPAAKKQVKTMKVNRFTKQCWKQCSRDLHF